MTGATRSLIPVHVNDFSTTDLLRQTATGAITGAVTAGVLKGGAIMYENYTGRDPLDVLAQNTGKQDVSATLGKTPNNGMPALWTNAGGTINVGATEKVMSSLISSFSVSQASIQASSLAAGPKHELIGLSVPFYERKANKIIEKADRTLCEVWDHSSCDDLPPSNEPLPSPGPMY